MEGIFQIGDFVFRILYPAEAAPPENFMKFKIGPEDGTQGRISRLEYTYRCGWRRAFRSLREQ